MQDQVDEVAGEEMFSQMALWIDEKVEKYASARGQTEAQAKRY